MLTWLRHFGITTRLVLILAFAIFGTLLLSWITLDSYYQKGFDERHSQAKQLVSSAMATVSHFQQLAALGELSQDTAQQQALTLLSQIRYGDDSNYFYIFNRDAKMVMHPVNPALAGQSVAAQEDANGKPIFRDMLDAISADGQGFVIYDWSNSVRELPRKKLAYVSLFQQWDWVIATGVYVDDLRDDLIQMIVRLILFLGLFGIPLMAVMALIVASVQSPMRDSQQAMARIAQGDADLSRRMKVAGKDELSALAVSFNTFAANMAGMVKNLFNANQQLEQLSGQLSSVAQQNTSVIEEEADQTGQLATAITQMSAASNEIKDNASQAAETTLSITRQVSAGRTAVSQTVATSERLDNELQQTSNTVALLNDDSQQIASILDVIGSIAEQTNLLALNAAIEAARAGDQGRGFAVVAGEVRDLASRTQQSTNEIQSMIIRIQQRVDDVINRVECSQQQANQTLQQAQESGDRFEQIDAAVSEMNQLNKMIADALAEQSLMTQHINESTLALSSHIDSSVTDNRKVSEAAVQVEAISQQISGMIHRFQL